MIVSNSFTHKDVLGLEFGYHPINRPVLTVHLYYIDGLLIDTGQAHCRQQILQTLKDLPIDQIFVTHHHEDHTGNVDALQKQHQCEVYATPSCCELMTNPPPISFAQRMVWGNRPSALQLVPVGNVIQTPNHRFELIPIPGHAPDMVALFEPDKKWLFSADLYINSYIGYMLKDESIASQINSIQKILQLDFEVLLCSHNPQLVQGKTQLRKKLDFLLAFYDRVAQLHQQGLSAHQIFTKLKLKENWYVRLFSGGQLSKLNMVKSVMRDVNNLK